MSKYDYHVWNDSLTIFDVHDSEDVFSCNIYDFPGQCGACVMADFEWEGEDDDVPLDKEVARLLDHTLRNILPEKLKVNKILASEIKNSPIYKFFMEHEWEYGVPITNKNSGNVITIFELTVKR